MQGTIQRGYPNSSISSLRACTKKKSGHETHATPARMAHTLLQMLQQPSCFCLLAWRSGSLVDLLRSLNLTLDTSLHL